MYVSCSAVKVGSKAATRDIASAIVSRTEVLVQLSHLTGFVEFEVSSNDGSELRFRIETLAQTYRRAKRFWCRIYRLETFRFHARSARAAGARRLDADYRCWVVDDNFDLESSAHKSATAALKAALATLEKQLGVTVGKRV
jgi:hypothetical protein